MRKSQVSKDIEILDDRSASGRVRPWAMYKLLNQYLSIAYDSINPAKAQRLRQCAQVLVYGRTEAENRLKLKHADFCRVRLCPICQWRRSLKNYGQIQKILKAIEGQYRFIFLTLTMRNCGAQELSEEITHLLDAFHLFTMYKEFKTSISGYYRGLEITHNTKVDTYHPHIHCLLAVKSTYFTKNYIKQEQYTELWKRALGATYTPIVDVRRVKGNDCKAIAEVAKYACKPDEIIYYDDWDLTVDTVRTLDAALDRRRLIAYGGIFKEMHKKLNLTDVDTDTDLTNIGDGDGEKVTDDDVIFVWHTGYSQYIKQ